MAMKEGKVGGDEKGSGANDKNATKASILGDSLILNSILKKTNVSNILSNMNAEKADVHGTNDVNRLNSSQQFTYAKVVTPYRVKNKINFCSLESEVGDVDADLIIPMTSLHEVNERFANAYMVTSMKNVLHILLLNNMLGTNSLSIGCRKL
nr:hypothetical protein [Tanacetum cinerariifolium]